MTAANLPWLVLLLDGDGTLFDSDGTIFTIWSDIVDQILAAKHPHYKHTPIGVKYTPASLRHNYAGNTFRQMLTAVAELWSVKLSEDELSTLERGQEQQVATALAIETQPTLGVSDLVLALREVSGVEMALVSSSSMQRIHACLSSTRLREFFPHDDVVFSGADSLRRPTSKPAPGIYRHAMRRLQAHYARSLSPPLQFLAVEDSVSGVQAAVAAGIPVLGYVGALPLREQEKQALRLKNAGARGVIWHWDVSAIVAALQDSRSSEEVAQTIASVLTKN